MAPLTRVALRGTPRPPVGAAEGSGVPGRLSRDSQDALQKAGHMAIDQDRAARSWLGMGGDLQRHQGHMRF